MILLELSNNFKKKPRMILVHLKALCCFMCSKAFEVLIVHLQGGFMVKSKDRSTIKFDLKFEIIAALKIAAAVRQMDPRDVLEDLVSKHLADFVALANKNKHKE
jgi:hypothetical protein